ncbi:PbsX family transcriptional regulator [Lonepinella koalarum]|uniref:AbrB/MazE/SpoVT family DNA-binding domain-containing protein n=1 Tax=Lonepinella koalarum TaxID=53417 RepID=UPI0011E3C427|nr:PbsX family transcriptional regulator [Lonepinella koalarum]TYG35117.1 PbsX family transcriptional regulator [Lonepinella koalarum]
MQVALKQWGDTVAIPIPSNMMSVLNIQSESLVDVREEFGRIIIEPVRKYSLDELVGQINDENLHNEVSFGKAEGNEIW